MELNNVLYIDCMDKKAGLPSLKDKSIDLCLTDPPYNREYKGAIQSDPNKQRRVKKDCYNGKQWFDDSIEDYCNFSKLWFFEVKRICNIVIFTPGIQNLHMWFDIEEPIEPPLIHYKRNCQSCTGHSFRNRYEPILVYGKMQG